jgi:hypothetical protein
MYAEKIKLGNNYKIEDAFHYQSGFSTSLYESIFVVQHLKVATLRDFLVYHFALTASVGWLVRLSVYFKTIK